MSTTVKYKLYKDIWNIQTAKNQLCMNFIRKNTLKPRKAKLFHPFYH